jgi:hypothetical protein
MPGRTILAPYAAMLPLLATPSAALACGMSAIGGGYDIIFNALLGVAGIVFLAGYLPYVGFSFALLRHKRLGTTPKSGQRIMAAAFAAMNTCVYLFSSMVFLQSGSIEVFIGDLFLWGTPFAMFVYGFRPAA